MCPKDHFQPDAIISEQLAKIRNEFCMRTYTFLSVFFFFSLPSTLKRSQTVKTETFENALQRWRDVRKQIRVLKHTDVPKSRSLPNSNYIYVPLLWVNAVFVSLQEREKYLALVQEGFRSERRWRQKAPKREHSTSGVSKWLLKAGRL